MHIRKGFVSNSSSSSFLIYGVRDPKISLEKLSTKEGLKDEWTVWYKEQQAKYGYPDTTFAAWANEIVDEGDIDELFYLLSRFAESFEIECETLFDEVFFGLDPRSMADNETMSEFKQRVCDTLALFIEGKFECQWHEEAWRDG